MSATSATASCPRSESSVPTTILPTVLCLQVRGARASTVRRQWPTAIGVLCGAACGFPRMDPAWAPPSVRPMTPAWHATPEDEVIVALATAREGLTDADARARLDRYGPNRLPEAAGPSAAQLLLDQVRTPLMWALLA